MDNIKTITLIEDYKYALINSDGTVTIERKGLNDSIQSVTLKKEDLEKILNELEK